VDRVRKRRAGEEERRTRGRGGDAFCCVSATRGNYRYREEGKTSTLQYKGDVNMI